MPELIHFGHLWSQKDALGLLSVVIMSVAYGIYLRKIHLKQVLPHPLTWVLFGTTTFIAFCVQVSKNAGAGTWVMGLTSLTCFVIFGFSWYQGRRLTHSSDDWISFWVALAILAYYVLTVIYDMPPTLAAIVATAADVVAYWPTVKKGWSKPYDDSFLAFFLNGAKFVPSLFALGPLSWATHFFPGVLVIVNALVAFMLLWRRWVAWSGGARFWSSWAWIAPDGIKLH